MANWLAFLREIKQDSADLGVGLVVIDTLAKHLPVKDENHATEVESALQPLWALTSQDIALLAIHHARKVLADDGTSARGSMAFNGHFEVLLELTKSDNTPGNCQRILKGMSRLKHVPAELVIELTNGTYSAIGDSTALARQQLELKILAYLASNNLANAGAVARGNGLSVQRASELLESLVASGQLSAVGDGTRRNPRQYQVL